MTGVSPSAASMPARNSKSAASAVEATMKAVVAGWPAAAILAVSKVSSLVPALTLSPWFT